MAKPLVVDATMYFGGAHERPLLPVRLRELRDVVDIFLVVEGSLTFQGGPHEPQFTDDLVTLAREWPSPLLTGRPPEIRYAIVGDFPAIIPPAVSATAVLAHDSRGVPFPENGTAAGQAAATREIHLRNSVTGCLDDLPGDTVVILSDFDEIPRASAVPRALAPGEFHRFGGSYFLYWLNLRVAGGYQWYGSRCVRLDELRQTTAEDLRQYRGEGGVGGQPGDLPDSAWHFSFLGGVDAIKTKLQAWRHPEFNDPKYLDDWELKAAVENGNDWWAERDLPLEWVDIGDDYPAYILEHPTQFRHLIGVPRVPKGLR